MSQPIHFVWKKQAVVLRWRASLHCHEGAENGENFEKEKGVKQWRKEECFKINKKKCCKCHAFEVI